MQLLQFKFPTQKQPTTNARTRLQEVIETYLKETGYLVDGKYLISEADQKFLFSQANIFFKAKPWHELESLVSWYTKKLKHPHALAVKFRQIIRKKKQP